MKARLPVSGRLIELQPPTGADDLLLVEAPALDTALALELAARLGRFLSTPDHPDPVAWNDLSVTDLEAALLRLRQTVFGDRVVAESRCPTCGAAIDVDFRIEEYLAHHTPQRPRELREEAGWWRLDGGEAAFRLPTAGDLVAVQHAADPAQALAHRCLRPATLPAKQRRRMERAMATLAPALSQLLAAACPDCAAEFTVDFDVQHFCLSELRDQAQYIYDDCHLLAATYHWREAEILALPRARRLQYAERIRQERVRV